MTSALSAYRADASNARGPFSELDDEWIAVASILEHACAVPMLEAKGELLRDAVELATQLLGERAVARQADEAAPGASTDVDALLALAAEVEEAGALNLGACILDTLADPRLDRDPLFRGRALAQRARITRKVGQLDEALDRYAYIDFLGSTYKLDDLRARAAIGRAAVAQMRGNYKEVTKETRRALALARRARVPRLERLARYGQVRALAAMGDFDAAAVAAWRLYSDSKQRAELAAEALQTVGQLFLERGMYEAARAAFESVVERKLPARVLLPAVGGLALASAYLGAEPIVEWTVREVTRIPAPESPGYPLPGALVECASALALLGRYDEAHACAKRALEIAEGHGFHELVIRAEALLAGDTPRPRVIPEQAVGPKSTRVARAVKALRPERLPEHLSLAEHGE